MGTLTYALSWANELIDNIDSGGYKSVASSWIKEDDIDKAVDTAMSWATDGNALVCTTVMPGVVLALQKGDLYLDYYEDEISTIEIQIAKGGYRLANWLNNIYSENVTKVERAGVPKMPRKSVDLWGPDLLPPPRPLSEQKMRRLATGYGYGCDHRD